jgi:UDP-N-acetylmuramoyl-tripeptide--D-alanyl-D-alanine ligase
LRYKVPDLLQLLTFPLGRQQLGVHAYSMAWPVFDLAARVYRRTLARRVRVTAVVGSYGKSTTTAALIAALGTTASHARGKGVSKVPLSVLQIPPRRTHDVLELSINRKGQMARHAATVRPDTVVFTSIGSEHHRSLGSLDDILEEKAAILDGLKPGGVLVLNGDDPRVRGLASRVDSRVVRFGIGEGNDVRATDIRLDWPHGTRFTLHVPGGPLEARVRLLGQKMVYSVLAAVAVALEEGRAVEDVLRGLDGLRPMPGRLEPVMLPDGVWVLRDDYKSSYETIDTALDVLADIPARRIAVIGDISEPPENQGVAYRRLGERLAGVAERVIVVGEHFRRYAVGAERGGLPRSAIVDAGRSFRRAVEALREDLRPGDVVLVKGRNTQRLERVVLALQDRLVRCEIPFCRATHMRCERCPMLERGWQDPAKASLIGARPG